MLSEQEFRTWMAETMFEDMPGEIYKFFQPHLCPDFPRAMVKGWFEKDFPSMPKLMLEQWLDTLERLWNAGMAMQALIIADTEDKLTFEAIAGRANAAADAMLKEAENAE